MAEFKILFAPSLCSHALMDNRAHGQLLTLTAFSTVIQYANWIIQHMASQSQEPTLRKQRAWWSDTEEVAFLDYLVKCQSQATHGTFKNLTIMVVINHISQRAGQYQGEWNTQVECSESCIS